MCLKEVNLSHAPGTILKLMPGMWDNQPRVTLAKYVTYDWCVPVALVEDIEEGHVQFVLSSAVIKVVY